MFYLGWQRVFVRLGDGEEWDQQCVWHAELMSGLDKVDVCVEQLQQDQEKWTTQGRDWTAPLQAMVRIMALWPAVCPCSLIGD